MALIYWLGRTGEDFLWGDWRILGRVLHPFSLFFVLSGSLMISTIKVPKP